MNVLQRVKEAVAKRGITKGRKRPPEGRFLQYLESFV
jgi:hypothetical protein